MALNVVSKISLSKKQIFVTSIKTSTVSCAYPASFRLSSLISIIHAQFIQPHFDYTCSVYPASFRLYMLSLSSLISIIHAQFIQPHFDYTCSVWYPNLNKKVKLDSKACRNN